MDEANRYHAGSIYLHAYTTLSISSLVPRLPDFFNVREKKIGEPGDEANRYHAGSIYLHACTTLSISSLVRRLPDLFQRTREKDRGAWGLSITRARLRSQASTRARVVWSRVTLFIAICVLILIRSRAKEFSA